MTERIDELQYAEPESPSTREILESNLFITQPAEFLVATFVDMLKADPVWSRLFGEYIDPYERMDFSLRTLPAMRVYIDRYRKDAETWYETGEVIIDVIWPSSIRRGELNRLPSTIAGAMIQQLRRPTFFTDLCDRVPGLNEFGRTVAVDFDLGFKWQDDIVPLTRITANFRILLDAWDQYLTSDYRTIDDPFRRTLGDLRSLAITIDALRSDDPEDVALTMNLNVPMT